MKKFNTLCAIILLMSVFTACNVKTTKIKTSSSTSGVTPGGEDPGGHDPELPGCDGIKHDGATTCYHKDIPTVQVMGATSQAISNGTPYATTKMLGSSYSQSHFTSDGIFNIRIVPRMAVKTNPALNPAVAGKSCNHLMTKIATKLWVQIKIQTSADFYAGSANGQVATLDANLNEPSKVWKFDVSSLPNDASSPLVLKVISVLTDSRCQQGGTGYCPYADLPLNSPTTTLPTECVAFDVQYATDTTYDLPGPRAN